MPDGRVGFSSHTCKFTKQNKDSWQNCTQSRKLPKSNDFDISEPHKTMWRHKDTKPLTEDHRAINVADLRRISPPKDRSTSDGTFTISGLRVRLVRDQTVGDWYLEIIDRGPRCDNSVITLLCTPCNYGSYREWLECPNCSKRVGILYLHEDNFKCRICLDLRYLSQRMNYQTMLPTFKRWAKAEKMDPSRCRYYKGKPTRYTRRYEKLQVQISMGVDIFGPKYTSR